MVYNNPTKSDTMFLADSEERAIFQQRPQLYRSGLELLLSCKLTSSREHSPKHIDA
jgi:hypothetical protein